ncbi:hypothetical protein AAHA92_00504 [Salvia divinorum]|uniref:Uncharacterized protein n=1 Tax=Salvia divinorum TaxID=28513 RepID=A0ABD1IJS5_SALDI
MNKFHCSHCEETISAGHLPLSSSAAVNLPSIDQYQQLISLLQSQHLHNSTSSASNSTSASLSQPLTNFFANASVNLPNGHTAPVTHLGSYTGDCDWEE